MPARPGFRLAESARFRCFSIDASRGLIEEARRRYPGVPFECDTVSALTGLESGSYANMLCETVIMRMPKAEALVSVRRMAEFLAPGGCTRS